MVMAEKQKFRTAINGFHREDVVKYIDYLNSRHESQLAQLRTDLQRAQEELERAKKLDQSGELEQLRSQCAAYESQIADLGMNLHQAQEDLARAKAEQKPVQTGDLEALRTRCARLEAELEQAKRPAEPGVTEAHTAALIAQLEQCARERDAANAQLEEYRSRAQEELEAYRRAERMERDARARAMEIFHQANAMVADTQVQLKDAHTLLAGAAQKATAVLEELHAAIDDTETRLSDTAAGLAALTVVEEQKD